jgi:hypothetical protein
MRPSFKAFLTPLVAILIGFLGLRATVTSVYGIQIYQSQFSSSDPVITFETGSTILPSVPGVQFGGATDAFSQYSFQCFGSQYMGDVNGGNMGIYFSSPQQAVGAYIVNDQWGSGVIEIAYDQSNNVIEVESQSFPPFGSSPVFLGIGEPTAQIYYVEFRTIPAGAGYFGVDNLVFGSAIGLSQMPNIPTGLSASLQGHNVVLKWSAAGQATSYKVERGTTSGGPYNLVASGVFGTNYTDTTTTNGGTYYYVLQAVNSYGTSAISQQLIVYVVDHFAFAAITSPQTSSVPFAVTISACDSNGLVLSNFNGAGMFSASGDYGIDQVTPVATSGFINGLWTGAVTVAAPNPDTNMRLSCSSNAVNGTSNPFNVVAPPIQEFNQTIADMVYNPFNKLIYATVSANGGAYSNCLIMIDPVLGRITNSYYLGNDPNKLDVSSDGRFLYVGFNATNAFARFNIASNMIDLEVPISSAAGGIAAIPGMPHSLAVSAGGVAIFDDGIQRSNTYPWGSFVIAGSADELFTLGGGYPAAPFAILSCDVSGITNYFFEDGIVGYLETVKYQDGLIFTSGGTVFSPATTNILGTLTNCSIVEPDLQAGTIYSMGSHPVWASPNAWTLYAWNSTNLQQVGSLPIPGVNDGSPTALIRWGTNGIAFNIISWYINQLYLVRTPLIPLVQPTLESGSMQAHGSFQLVFTGDVAYPYTIRASTNFLNWTQIGAPNLMSNDWLWFSDSNVSMYPQHFYRISVP